MHGDGAVYEVVTTDYANTVADNVYRYASREDYYGCAREAFEEIHALLKCLIRFFTRLRRPKEAVLLEHMYRKFNYFGLNGAYTHQTQIYDPISRGHSGGGGGHRF